MPPIIIPLLFMYSKKTFSPFFKTFSPFFKRHLFKPFSLKITLAFFIFSLIGGLFSVRAVLKIDPLKAIGG